MDLLCSVYRIQEGTKNEYVSVGSDGNIRRWPENGEDGQQWILVPVNATQVNILTCQREHRNKGERMAVGSNGNIRRWERTGGIEQLFSITDKTDGWVNIGEFTEKENVAVGPDGNVLRWRPNGGKDQLFKLEPMSPQDPPKVRKGEYKPDQIPDVPRLTDFKSPPKTTDPCLIAEVVYPAFFVDDPAYRSKAEQVAENPYYIMRREQFWQLSDYKEFSGRVGHKHEHEVIVGMSTTDVKSLETTTKIGLTQDFSFKLAPEVEFKGFKIKGAEDNASFGASFMHEIKMTRSTTNTTMRQETKKYTKEIPPGKRFALAVWVLCDRFRVLNGKDRSQVGEWVVRRADKTIEDLYPR